TRAGVFITAEQVRRQHRGGLRPGRHVRPADPLALIVVGHALFLPAVGLHISGVQIDRRLAGQDRDPLRGEQSHHPAGAAGHTRRLARGAPAGQPPPRRPTPPRPRAPATAGPYQQVAGPPRPGSLHPPPAPPSPRPAPPPPKTPDHAP